MLNKIQIMEFKLTFSLRRMNLYLRERNTLCKVKEGIAAWQGQQKPSKKPHEMPTLDEKLQMTQFEKVTPKLRSTAVGSYRYAFTTYLTATSGALRRSTATQPFKVFLTFYPILFAGSFRTALA